MYYVALEQQWWQRLVMKVSLKHMNRTSLIRYVSCSIMIPLYHHLSLVMGRYIYTNKTNSYTIYLHLKTCLIFYVLLYNPNYKNIQYTAAVHMDTDSCGLRSNILMCTVILNIISLLNGIQVLKHAS